MKRSYHEQPNGYLETIQKGLDTVHCFRSGLCYGTGTRKENIARLKAELETADAIVSVKRDMRDKPVVDQRMKSIRVETFGQVYPFDQM